MQQLINNRYEVQSRLGKGNQGEVVSAIDTKLGRVVAIKLLSTMQQVDERARKSLKREAMVMAQFDHPNVVSVYDYDVTEDLQQPFLVMEYLQGDVLSTLRPPLTDLEHLQLVRQVGSALSKAHQIGLVHRDLKPANLILVDRDKRASRFIILDLGIAKLMESATPNLATLGSMTFSGAGTPLYMAPEQVDARETDHRADIYAMGSIIYEALTGQSPFSQFAVSLPQLLNAVVTQPPVPVSAIASRSCTTELEHLVMQCLEKRPEKRPQTMDELVARFEQSFSVHSNPIISHPDHSSLPSETAWPPTGQHVSVAAEVLQHENLARSDTSPPSLDPTAISTGDFAESAPGVVQEEPVPYQTSPDNSHQPHPPSKNSFRKMSGLVLGSGLALFLVAGGATAFWGNPFRVPRESANSTAEPADENGMQQAIQSIDLGSQLVAEETAWTFQPNFKGEGLGQFKLNGEVPTGLAIDEATGVLSWQPTELQGPASHLVSIEAISDERQSLHYQLKLEVSEVNLAPSLSPSLQFRGMEGRPFEVSLPASDDDWPRQNLEFELVDTTLQGFKITPDTGIVSWLPSERDGGKQVAAVIQVSDGVNYSRSTIWIDVEEDEQPPQFEVLASQSVEEFELLQLQLRADDPDFPTKPLRYSLLSNELEGAKLDPQTGRFEWRPREAQGPGEFLAKFEVTDGTLSTTQEVLIQVFEVAQAPLIRNIPNQELAIGDSLSLQVEATDQDVPQKPLNYSIVQGPDGLTIDGFTGNINWTPLPTDIGKPHSVIVEVGALQSPQAKAEFQIEVGPGALFTNSIGMKFRFLPAGTQPIPALGREKILWTEDDVKTPILFGVHEVTLEQFRTFVNEVKGGYRTTVERTEGSKTWLDPGFAQDEDHPVVALSREDADAFCKWLSEREGRTYRLPTKTEWEYACLAGKQSMFSFGDDESQLVKHANSQEDDGFEATCKVGTFEPNPFGLYDMHGNAEEPVLATGSVNHNRIAADLVSFSYSPNWIYGSLPYMGGNYQGCCAMPSHHGDLHSMPTSGLRIVCEVDELR